MKAKKTGWPSNGRKIDIGTAVENACDGSAYGQGELETLKYSLEKTQALLGRLVERLAEKGALKVDDVEAILDYGWEVTDD
jgi:hypothetical protein